MGYRVTKRRNQDGSITKTTTYSYKTIFGNRKTETRSERIPPKHNKTHSNRGKARIPWWLWLIIALVIISLFSQR